MARVDVKTLNAYKLLNAKIAEEGRRALDAYHQLSTIHSGLETLSDRQLLAMDNPEIAAQVFYHCNDFQLGRVFVKMYKSSKDARMRELAHGITGVLNYRETAARDIATITGMQVVPSTRPDSSYDRLVLEGNEHNAERLLEL